MRSEDLTEPESRVVRAFARGDLVDMGSGDPGADDAAQGENWSGDRTVRADVAPAPASLLPAVPSG